MPRDKRIRRSYLDPIEYAWMLCNPRTPFPESLRESWRGAPRIEEAA